MTSAVDVNTETHDRTHAREPIDYSRRQYALCTLMNTHEYAHVCAQLYPHRSPIGWPRSPRFASGCGRGWRRLGPGSSTRVSPCAGWSGAHTKRTTDTCGGKHTPPLTSLCLLAASALSLTRHMPTKANEWIAL